MDYIRARYTFVKKYDLVERTTKAEIRREEQNEKAEIYHEGFMECNTVETAIKTETDTRTE